MGAVCCGPPKDKQSALVDKELKDAEQQADNLKKLLLLGAGGSGKSTFFKQLQRIHGTGFNVQERLSFKSQIYEQIITQMQLLLEKSRELSEQDPTKFGDLKVGPGASAAAEKISYVRSGVEITPEIAQHIKTLWMDAGIQNCFEMRAKLCIFDSSGYFFSNVERIANKDYQPTDDDLLYVRHRTTGMNEKVFVIQGTAFSIVDVGGQRSERRKWIHFFEGVTAIVFVASLSSYDEVLYEDETVIVMDETLNVFEEHFNSSWFKDSPFILFLNKSDLFEEKIKKTPLQTCFQDYQGTNDIDECLDFVKFKFEERNKDNPDEDRTSIEPPRTIYTHVTCATDEGNVERVFNDVQHIVINNSLARSGLLC